ncbi:MAG: M36 family metallopeptidase, partial [Pseudomonadota bacterium]
KKQGLNRRETLSGVAYEYLSLIAQDYGLDSLDSVSIKDIHDLGEGAIVVTFVQQFSGIEVFGASLKLILDQEFELKAVSGYLSPFGPTTSFSMDERQGLDAARISVGRTPEKRGANYTTRKQNGYTLFERNNDSYRIKPVYYLLPGRLEASYYVELNTPLGLRGQVVSAENGELKRSDKRSFDHRYRVWTDGSPAQLPIDGPQGTNLTPHPTGEPDGIAGPFVNQRLVDITTGPISTGDPWLAVGATQTTGNNAQAYADLQAPDGFTTGDVFGQVSTPGTNLFDYTYNPALLPGANNNQIQATIVQAFYTINYLHDWFYDAGFNEVSGNTQFSNFGRGGLGNDAIRVEVQDYNVSNNANASVPQDGSAPRIQMGLFANDSILDVNSPAAVAGSYVTGSATFGPQTFDVTGNLVLVNDGQVVGEDGATTDACETPFVNAAQVSGNVAFIDRGECFFADKAANAQAAGAIAVLIANNNPGEGVLNMGAPDNPPVVNIPLLLVSFEDGQAFRNAAGPVNVRLRRGTLTAATSSALDTTILAHEWGHVLNNRLMVNLSSQSNGMDEGWADFIALLLVTRPEDIATQFRGTYGVGSFAQSIRREGNPSFPAYYYGIRRVPYTTDFSRNALSFRHIQSDVALPGGVETQFGEDGANNEEVHASGEVWATAAWECYAGLLNGRTTLTFDEVQRRMRNYTVATQKAVPASPTFTETKDAMLTVMLASDAGDHDLCARAFARRGLGQGSVSPPRFSTDHAGVVESFENGLPDRSFKSVAAIGYIAGSGTNAQEILGFQVSDALVNQLRVSDASSGTNQGTLSFLGSVWSPKGLVSVNGIGTSGRGVGVFAVNNDNDVMAVQMRNASDGVLTRNIFPLSAAWRGLDIDTVPGQAVSGLSALAVLAERRSDNLMTVELLDPTSGSRIRLLYPLGFGWRAEQLGAVDVNGTEAIAVLATRESDGLAIVQVRNAVNNALVRNVFPLGLGWSPIELKVLPDLNGNNVEEVAVRMTRDADGLEIIQIRDAQTNDLVGNVYPIGAGAGGWQTQSFEAATVNGNTVVSILSVRDSDAQVLVQNKDPLTGNVLRNNFFIGPPWVLQPGFEVVSDYSGNGNDELAVLMTNPNTRDRIIQIRDAGTGSLIRNVFQPR